jgi:hypothetical protein
MTLKAVPSSLITGTEAVTILADLVFMRNRYYTSASASQTSTSGAGWRITSSLAIHTLLSTFSKLKIAFT